MTDQAALPGDAQAENSRGLAALSARNPDQAAEHFSAAVAIDGAAAPLWRNLATAHRARGDASGERTALEQALSLDRTEFSTWLRKAQLHQRLGEDSLAMAAWSATLQLAAGLPSLPEPVLAELDVGREAMARWQARLAEVADGALAPLTEAMSATEQRRTKAFVDLAVQRRRAYVNECSGLYYPFLPADEFFDADRFPWFDLVRAAAEDVRTEFVALQGRGALPLRPYVRMEQGSPQTIWSALDGNQAWSAAFLWEYGVPNTALLELCPRTAAMLAAIDSPHLPGRAPTAFFSILRAGAVIPPHTGVSNTRSIVHLPLVVPQGCVFRVGGETRQWTEGEPFAFDDTIEHEANNPTDQDRVVLIFDVWNPHLTCREREVIEAHYAAADRAGLNPGR